MTSTVQEKRGEERSNEDFLARVRVTMEEHDRQKHNVTGGPTNSRTAVLAIQNIVRSHDKEASVRPQKGVQAVVHNGLKAH